MNWKLILKLSVSALIIWLVLRNIDERLLWNTMQRAHPGWLLWAVLWFAISKVISAFRFNAFLKTENIFLDTWQQIRLYWVGMYYNLLLPGGISGDGYKIKLLKDRNNASVKRLISLTLLERLSGAAALGQLCLLLLLGLPIVQPWWWIPPILLALSIPATWLMFKYFGGNVLQLWIPSSLQSIAVQLGQIASVLGVIWALEQGHLWLEYTVLFLISSVVAVLPLTIGGTGAREITFLWGSRFLGADTEIAVAIAFLFYLVQTLVSFSGIAFSLNLEYLDKPEEESVSEVEH